MMLVPLKRLRSIAMFLLGAVALLPAAKADSIVGSFSLVGGDTFDATSIQFVSPAYVLSSTLPGLTGLLSVPTNVQTVTLTNFFYASAPGTMLFTTTGNGITVTFTISTDPSLVTTTYIAATPPGVNPAETASLKIQGYGILTDTGYTDTAGRFSLTSSSTGATSFQVVGDSPDEPAVVPEPSSLLMLGTGLLSAVQIRRRARMTTPLVA